MSRWGYTGSTLPHVTLDRAGRTAFPDHSQDENAIEPVTYTVEPSALKEAARACIEGTREGWKAKRRQGRGHWTDCEEGVPDILIRC